MSLGFGETQWKDKKLMKLDWYQSKMPRVINEFCSKLIDNSIGYRFLKLGHQKEEGSARKIILLCKSDSETPNSVEKQEPDTLELGPIQDT